MSKAPEENGGVTTRQQQAPELCTCGVAHRAKLEQHQTVTTGRRSSLDSPKGGGLQPNLASGASSSRAPAAAYSPSLEAGRSSRDTRKSGDLKSPSVYTSPLLQGEKKLRAKCGDLQQPKSSLLGTASPSSQEARRLRDNRRNGVELQQAKSPSVDASPSFQWESSLRDSQRRGDVQQPKGSSGNASPCHQGERSSRGSRNLDEQKSKSPSVNVCPSCLLKDNRRVGDEQQQARSHSLDVSPSFHRERGLSDSFRNGDVPMLKYPSVGLSDSLRNGDVPLLGYPSVAPSSRATPSPGSPPILRCGSLGESVSSEGTYTNLVRAAPTAPSSTWPSLKSKLAAGHKLYGAFLVSFSTVVAEILGWAGYDFVVVDLEQLFPGDTLAALPVLQALASTGTPAILRLPADDPVLVNKALDMGPAGLMFSMIENEEAARNAVASCRYPPRGTRRGSRHVVSRASRYGLDVSYMDRCEEELLVICQVEITEALDHIMDIAGVEGVDCIQMGGLDFGASLGDPYLDFNTRLLFCHAEEKVAGQRKVLLAGFSTPESSADVLFKRGYHIVSGALDVVLLRNAALADLQRNKPSVNL